MSRLNCRLIYPKFFLKTQCRLGSSVILPTWFPVELRKGGRLSSSSRVEGNVTASSLVGVKVEGVLGVG